ncbi:hypothetical protein HYP71_gp094 [Arthrobacter phage KBurrousTX]|uniref:Uncharacterized protein n=1 Tax=Arthrobacter phage KBurrousTX TaxID=2315608 RepID=A0A386K8B5_9CAUD|nr:hypothetical protein HYP71_gp094 [Arthrobacter phage KBurrousTX]AYD81588.1 hypothetical protein KBurrousTX_94 [Arthrobacter phage KBurrousTX]
MSDHIAAIRADLDRERLRLLEQVSAECHQTEHPQNRAERAAGNHRARILVRENAAFYAQRKAKTP